MANNTFKYCFNHILFGISPAFKLHRKNTAVKVNLLLKIRFSTIYLLCLS
jgi:hypothetical protein